MAHSHSSKDTLGSLIPDFCLPAVDGKDYGLKDFKDSKALVVVFMCNHCPYVIAIQNKINQLAISYQPKGVAVIGINSNDATQYPEDSFAAMKQVSQREGYVFPYLWDETQQVAKSFDAQCTPDFFVYAKNSQGEFVLEYQGRMDDSKKGATSSTRNELAEALDQILIGNAPSSEQHPALGCSIKWKI